MAGNVDSQSVNMNEFIRTRLALSPDQAKSMVTHHNVVRKYSALLKRDYPKADALEEALTEVFCGGMTRGMRVYKTLATEANVTLLEAYISGERVVTDEELNVPDLIEVKKILRSAEDIASVSEMLVAERAGNNADGKPRKAVVKILSDKIRDLVAPEPRETKASAADVEDLAREE